MKNANINQMIQMARPNPNSIYDPIMYRNIVDETVPKEPIKIVLPDGTVSELKTVNIPEN